MMDPTWEATVIIGVNLLCFIGGVVAAHWWRDKRNDAIVKQAQALMEIERRKRVHEAMNGVAIEHESELDDAAYSLPFGFIRKEAP